MESRYAYIYLKIKSGKKCSNGMYVDEQPEEKTAPIGNYFIYVSESDKVDIHVGNQRTSHITIKDMTHIAETISTIIPPVYLGQYENLGNIACHIEKKDKNDVASMRVLKYSSQYETTFSLMNNNPENKKIDWEIREAVQSYLTPFLKEISAVSNFTIDSQVSRRVIVSANTYLHSMLDSKLRTIVVEAKV